MEYKSTESVCSIFELQEKLPPVGKGTWARFFPYGFWYEWKQLSTLAFPIMLTSLINYLIAPVSLFFLGQLGKTELAAGGLAIAIFHVAGVSIVVGLLSASETFFSQTFGGSNKFRLGIQVQRAAVILLICCFPCWAIYIIIEPILLASKQPPLVAKYTGDYLLGLMPALLGILVCEVSTKYVQAQNKVFPPLIASIIGNLVNAGAHYVFIYHSSFGLLGSALSQSLGYVMQAATVIAYIFISRLYRKTWDSVHVELWHDWGLWFRLAIPGMLMSGLEWWVCESGSLVSGLRGEQALAAQTIINNIESVIYCTFPLGFGIASTIRIGQFLGANKAVGPRSTALVALAMIAFTTVINAFILTFARYQIPRIFTNDRGVIEMVGQSLFSIVAFQFVDSIVGVASGIIRGVGMQQVGAIVCGVCMYLVGGPIGLCLLLLTDLSVAGFWWGLTAGMGLESIIYVILILKIDWNDMCTKAAKRTEIKFVHAVPGQREIEIKDDDVREDVLPETSDFHEERVEACTPVIIFTRATMISVSFLMLVIALLCRFLFNWKAYFPTYCLLGNGTVIQVPLVDDKLNAFWNGTSCVRIIP